MYRIDRKTAAAEAVNKWGEGMAGRVRGSVFILVFTAFLFVFLSAGCMRREKPQQKMVVGQEVKIAVSLADMERDGNQTIKKAMTRRQGGGQQGGQDTGGQQGDQGGQEGGGGQAASSNPASLPVISQHAGQQGGQGQQRVKIIWLDAKNDPAQQEKDLDKLAGQKVRAVILQPVDPAAGPTLVRKLAQAGIKVIALEALPVNAPLDGLITPDHDRTGELQARYLLTLAQTRPAGLRAVILQGDKNDRAARGIAASLLEHIRVSPAVKIVQVKEHPGGDPQLAAATVEQLVTTPGPGETIDAFVATDSRMAVAAAEVLKKRGLAEKVVTIGVGADEKAAKALAAGDHDAEVDIMPDFLAQYAYDAAVGLATTGHWQYDRQIKNGDFDVPAKITPVRLITKDEVYLLEQRWGKLTGQQGQQGQQAQGQEGGQQGGGGKEGQGNSGNSGSGGNQSQNSTGGGGQGASGKKKTTLKITTQDGKTVEMQIDGEIKRIESVDGTGQGGAGGQGGGQQGGQ